MAIFDYVSGIWTWFIGVGRGVVAQIREKFRRCWYGPSHGQPDGQSAPAPTNPEEVRLRQVAGPAYVHDPSIDHHKDITETEPWDSD